MKLIIGLGNPGQEYSQTRHNIGFMILDELNGAQGWKLSKKAKADFSKIQMNDQAVELLKPLTYMNESGQSVAYAVKKHKIRPQDVLVIHDDKDLLLGTVKIQTNRSSAGHNGIKSIINHLGTQNFTRIRIGIAPHGPEKPTDAAKYVLGRFSESEKIKLDEIKPKVIEEVIKWVGKKD